MGRRIINVWSKRNDSIWIDGRVTSIIMALDMLHIDSASHARDLIYVFGIIEQIRILSKQFLVALEVNSINLYS